MSVIQQFRDALDANPCLRVFIDNVSETPHGVQYDFDGKMTCRLIERDGRFYDYADIDPDEPTPDEFCNISNYASVRDYMQMLVDICR